MSRIDTHTDPTVIAQLRQFALSERARCVSDREWAHRLRGYGYDLRQTERGRVLATLPHGVEVCTLNG